MLDQNQMLPPRHHYRPASHRLGWVIPAVATQDTSRDPLSSCPVEYSSHTLCMPLSTRESHLRFVQASNQCTLLCNVGLPARAACTHETRAISVELG